MQLEAHVDRAEALRYLGHAGQTLDAELTARFDRAVSLCEGMTAQGVAHAFRVQAIEPASVHLEQTPFVLEGHDIAAHVAGACEVVLMAVTLGLASEGVLRRESARNATNGLLVDACASTLAESAADELNRIVCERAHARGLRAGTRFSPGYGDFPLSAQRAFLTALGADKTLGISVTRGDLLVPAKSITAVLGLYPADEGEAGGGGAGFAGTGGAADAAGGSVAAASADVFAAAPARAVGRTCSTCPLASTCMLKAQGRTCHGL